jgi:hypothetical protein
MKGIFYLSIFSVAVMTGITFLSIISNEHLVLGIPNKNASAPTNANSSGAISANNNNNSTSGSGSDPTHNVTTSAGSGGHIYRGGTISGSGGE